MWVYQRLVRTGFCFAEILMSPTQSKVAVYSLMSIVLGILSYQFFILVDVFVEPFHTLFFAMIWIVTTIVVWWLVKVSLVVDSRPAWWIRGIALLVFVVVWWSFYATRADALRSCICGKEGASYESCRARLSVVNLSPYYSLWLAGCKTEGK